MKKRIKLAAILFFAILFISIITVWLYPVKRSISNTDFDISDYVHDDEIGIVAEYHAVTGFDWQVISASEPLGDYSDLVVLEGVRPKDMKYPIYNYPGTKFLFVGHYDLSKRTNETGETVDCFVADRWYTVGKIQRMLLLPYPSYGFNIFEIKL